MTVMTPMEAKREKHRDAVDELIPDPEAIAVGVIEDLSIPSEAESAGLECEADVIDEVLERVCDRLDAAPVPRDAQEFVEEEKDLARDIVPVLVEEEFEGVDDGDE